MVDFTPTTIGEQPAGTLTILSFSGRKRERNTVSLKGIGVEPTVLSESSVAFGNVAIGESSAAKTLTLINYLLTPISIRSITVPSPYSVTGGSCVPLIGAALAGSSSCTITMTLTPTALGAVAASSLTVSTSAPNSPLTASLTGTGVAPTTLSETSLAFGAVIDKTKSRAQSITLTNNQVVPLRIDSMLLALGANSPFAITPATTCSTRHPLAAYASCHIHVTFEPTAMGAQSDTLTINTNASINPPPVALTGEGIPPTTLSATSLNFGSVGLNQTSAVQTFTLTNNQSTTLRIESLSLPAGSHFALNAAATTCAHPGNLGRGATCTIGLTFTPTTAGVQAAMLTIATNASNSPQTVALSGTGVAATILSVSSLSFGNEAIGEQSGSQIITVTNNGTSILTIESITLALGAASPFSIDPSPVECPNPGPLAAGASCAIGVTFMPLTPAPQSDTLILLTSASSSPLRVPLSGMGVLPVAFSSTTLTFPATFEGTTSAAQTFTLTNNQNYALTISSENIAGADPGDFSMSSTCPTASASLPAGQSCSINVTFTPTATGTRTATLNIADSASGSPQSIALTGPGEAPVTVLPGSITNFTAPVGSTSAYQTITITNVNTAVPLILNSFQLSGDFLQSATTCPIGGAGLTAANPTCTVAVQFNPTIGGIRTGQLQVYDNAATSPQVVNLSGAGTSPLTLSVSSMTFSAQKLGTTSLPKTMTLTNHEVQAETFTLTLAGDFIASSNCPSGVIAAQSLCVISVQFAPTSTTTAGPDNGSLTLANSATNGTAAPGASPLNVSLLGSASTTNPPAAVSSVSPGAGAAGTTVNVVITGNGWTNFSSSSVISFVDVNSSNYASDITVQSFTAVNSNQIDATLVLGANSLANPVDYGARSISVVTPLSGGGTETAQLTSAFIIADPSNVHILTSAAPNTGVQGQTLNVALTATGTNFVNGTTYADFGDGVTVNTLTVTDATDAVANITINNTTYVGYRSITLVTGGEFAVSSATAFQIDANNATLLSVSPNSAGQGSNLAITLTASGTHFLQDATQVSIAGGVTVGNVQVTSLTTAVAQLIVPQNATVGVQNVTISTGGEIATLANAFTVINTTPAITSVNPTSGQQGQTLNVEIQGLLTNFTTGQLQAQFGGDIVVNSYTVNSTTDVILNISIRSTAATGSRTVQLTSGPSGSATILQFGFTVTQSSAQIVSLTPVCVPQGGQMTIAVTGVNTNWLQGTTTAGFYTSYPLFPVATIGVDEVTTADSTDLTLNVAVSTATPVGSYSLYVVTGGEIVSASMGVCAATPTLSMSPANGLPGTSFSVAFSGQFTHFVQGTTLPVIAGQGVTLSNFQVTSPVSATGTLTIDPTAAVTVSPATLRLVTFTTGNEIVTTYFNVTATPVGLLSISPYQAQQDDTLNVEIVGLNTHFTQGTTQVLFGPFLTVNSVTVNSATDLIANVTTSYLDASVLTASPVGYQSIFVNTGAEQVIGGFTVTGPASPTLVSVVPSSAQQGATVDVAITGSLTNWVQGTTEAILGAGVTVSNLTITSPTTATATLAVSPTAPVGGNSVILITGPEIVSGTGFNVTPNASSIVSVLPPGCSVVSSVLTCNGVSMPSVQLPWQVSQLQTSTLNIVGVGTHWLQGETSVSFGSGIVIDSLTVNSPTTATVQITVLSTAPVGFAALTTVTDGEVVTLQQAIDVEQGFPTLLATSPSGSLQGNTLNLQVLGRFTSWQQGGTTAAFNQDITVNSVTVTDSDSLIANITVNPTAYIDYLGPCSHVLTITTGTEQVTGSTTASGEPGIFCVSAGPAGITLVQPNTGLQGTSETITVTGSQSHFVAGVTQAYLCVTPSVSLYDPCGQYNPSFPNDPDSGINVGTITVNSPTSATIPVALSTSSTVGYHTIALTTLGEVATEQFAFTVQPNVATLNEAIPNQTEQGIQNLTVQLIGQYSHFSTLSTATFGEGVTVVSVSYVSATEVDAVVNIDPLSFTGSRTVTVTTPNVPCALLVNDGPNACPANSPTGSTGSEIVSTSGFTIVPGPAIISNLSPATGNEGQEVVFNITGSATHWAQNFTQFYIAGGGSDLTINSVIINSPTSATVDMNISPTANPGTRSVYMVTAGESLVDSGAFVVTGGVPVVAYLSPNNGQPGASQLEVVLHGIYTAWTQAATTLNFGPGVTVASYQVDDNFTIEAVLNIDSAAQPGYRTVVVQTGTQSLTGNFLVEAPPEPPTPSIWYWGPSSGLPGQTFTVSFTGYFTSWDPIATTATFGSGIQVNSFQVTSPTSALANITITATQAQTNLIVFTTGAETESVDFNVVIAQPTLSIVDPGAGMQGAQNLTINILGQYTTFDSTTTFSFGSGITVHGPPTILGPTIATQSISIPQLAPLGSVGVVANTPDASGSEQTVGGASFTITPSLALISAIAPNSGLQGQSVQVEVTGQNTHWDATTQFQFGAGIAVASTQVNSNTDATLTLAIPALAPEGPTNASATTGGEVASIPNGFVIQAGTPLLLSSAPASVPQQGNVVFTILSQSTNWTTANPPTVSFGAGIVLTELVVTGPTSLTVEGYVQPTAYLGYRNLTVVSGTQVLGINNAVSVGPGPAAINSVTPNTAGQGATLNVTIAGTNTNWVQGVTQLTFPGVLMNTFTVNSPTSIGANITVSDYTAAGEVSLTATTLGEAATGVNVFTVTQTQPELLAVVASSGAQGATETVTLTAVYTHFTSASVVNFGAGVTVNSVNAIDSEHLQANITVQPTAALGNRNVSITTGSEAVSLNNAFQVTVGPAAIAGLNPATGAQGASVSVVVTGSQTNFAQGITTASFGGGIQVTGLTVTDLTHASVAVTIPSNTALGSYNVVLTTGGEVATILNGFTVTVGAPVLSAVNPPNGHQGDTNLSVSLTGLFTNFVNGSSAVSFGAGITVNSLTVSDATYAVANITISQTATIGSRNVTVTTGAEVATLPGGFSVLAGVPRLVSANPASAQAGVTANVVITGLFTTFQQGFTTVSFGAGITVNSVAVNGLTQLIANIGVGSNATPGSRDITVTTNSQTETLSAGFTVTPGTPAITQINPNIGSPGQTVTVTLIGQYTNWSAATTASFGPQISVGGAAEGASGPVTVSNATTLTATLTIDPNAALGPVSVVVTTGAEIESIAAGFTVQPAAVSPPTVVSLSPGAYATGMPINSSVIAVFSQPMMRSTINASNVLLYLISNPNQGWISVPGTVSLDASGLVVTFTPNASLAVNSQYEFVLTSAIQDATGNSFNYGGGPYWNGNYYVTLNTVFAANTAPPTVIAANPPANSNNVGTNVTVQIEFSADMDQATQAGVTVSSGGTNVPGTFSWNSNEYCWWWWWWECGNGPGTVVAFTPTASLQQGTVYTVSYGAPLADTAGNTLTAGSFTFTTGSAADTSNNSVSGFIFQNGEANLGTNFVPKVLFTRPVNPLDINTGTLFLYNYDSGKYVQGTVTLAADAMSATFTPALPLLPNTGYDLYMSSGYYDMDGNYLNGTTSAFTTGAGQDLAPPRVASVYPADGTTLTPLNTQVVAHFSEAIDPTSSYAMTVMAQGGSGIAGTTTLASDQVTLTFVPTGSLQPNTPYTVQVSGYADMAGNAGTTFTSSFTTMNSVAPLNLSTGVDASGNLITTGGTADPHWVVTPFAASSSQTAYVVAPGEGGWSPNWSIYGYADGPLSSVITVDPNNAQGYPNSTYTTTFNLSGYSLDNLCLVGAVQGDPYGTVLLNGLPITNSSQFYPWEGLASINIALPDYELNQGTNTISYQLASEWDGYEGFRLQGAIQTCGVVLSGGLSVVSTSPASGSTGVPTNTSFTIRFNNPIDPATVNASTLPVMIGWNGNAGIAGAYQVSGNTVTFTPDSPFPVNTQIYLGNCNGPYDTAGETISGCYASQLAYFTTATTATSVTPTPAPFQVIAFTPTANAANVGLRAPVVATFNRSVNPNTINQGNATADFALFNGGAQSPWCLSYAKSQDNATLQFHCAALPSSATMTAMLNSNLQDFSGNALANFTSQFSTMSWDSSSAGSMVSTRPGTGSSGINLNEPLTLYANLPINPASANTGLQVAENNVAVEGSVQVVDNGYTLEFTPASAWTPGALVQWWTTSNLTDASYGNSFTVNSGYFYATGDTSTLTPTIQAISPPDGSTTATNSFIDLQFNTPLNPSTVNSSSIYLYDYYSGLNVSGTYSMPQPNVVRIVPSGALNANDYFQLYVNSELLSATSVPANAVGGWSDYFYTSASADITVPTIVSAVPYSGATNVGVNVTPGVVFSKAIDPVSVNGSTFLVTNAGAALPGSFWISSDDTRIEFVPNAPLPANSTLSVTLNGVLDRVGNSINFNSQFQTGAGPDVTSPVIVQTSIPSGGSIPINSTIVVQFSESMDVTTFSTNSNFFIEDTLLGEVPATLSWSSNQTVAYLTPSAPLAAGREFYLFVSGGTDLAGNSTIYSGNTVYFYTDLSDASTAPTVLNFNPSNGATGLGTNTMVEAQFSAPIDPNTLAGATLTANGNTVSTSPILSAGNTVLQLVPAVPLMPNTTYTMTIGGVKDPAGNQVATVTNSFTTGSTFDINSPTVTAYDPPYNSTVGTNAIPRIEFSKPLNPITVSNSTFNMYLHDTGQWIPLSVVPSANGLVVSMQPQIPLLPNTGYSIQAYSYQDQDGNSGTSFSDYFITGNGAVIAGPTVTVSPLPGATGIPLNAQILAASSALIDPTSWSQSSIQLLDNANNPVAGIVSLSNDQILTFVPVNLLSSGIPYTVNVSGFTDISGNAVTPSSTTFSTGSAAATGGLTLASTNIPFGSTNVSATQPIILTFSQALDPATVNNSTLPVMTGWTRGVLAGSYAVSGNTVTFTPTSPYPAGATIYAGECGGPTDLLGEVFYNGNCWQQQLAYFIVTTATPDISPLQVVSVNPANGATNVRHEIPIAVTFNKSINPGTAAGVNAQLYAGQNLQTEGSVTMSADNRTMTFNVGALSDGVTYAIILPANGIADMSGNALASNFMSTFTTATNPATSAGSIQAARPNWSSSGVPTDTLLTLFVTRPVNASTLPGNLTVTVNGQLYAGTVQSQASGYEVQFTPSMPFPNGALVQWFFSANVLDVNGNAFAANSGYFYTVAAINPATASPQIVAVSPACCSSTTMPTNGEIDIEYSLPIDATTLSGNISINAGPATPISVALAPGSQNIVRVTPLPSWNPSTGYGICANSSVLGVNGVAAPKSCSTTVFTATNGPDATSGSIKIGPPNGSINVGTNAYIRLQFSKPVDVTSINTTNVAITAAGNPIPGTWTYNYSSSDVIGANFYPENPLPVSSPIQVSVSGLLDYAGNTFAATSASFTTAASPDYTTPSVALDFNSGQSGIATNASFNCRYSEAIDPSSVNTSNTYIYSNVNNGSVPVSYTWSADLMTVTMTPLTALFVNAQYNYNCTGAIDLTGNAQNGASAGFYTGSSLSSAGPLLLQANPPNGFANVPLNSNNGPWYGTSLGLLFNEPVASDSLGAITLTATPVGGGSTSTIPINAYPEFGNTILAVQLPYVLQPNTIYTYNVAGVTDYNGNPMTPATSTFTTGSSFDSVTPTVAATNPVNGASNVDVNTQSLSVTFSEAMDPVLLNNNEVFLELHNTGALVPTTYTISPDSTTISLTPTVPLAETTIYDLVINPNSGWWPTDIAGNSMSVSGYVGWDNGYVFSTFTTNTAIAVNGACGLANGQSFATAPAVNLCSAGTASSITNPGSWTWSCNGEYGGANAACSGNVTLTSTPYQPPSSLVSWWPGNDNANDVVGGNNGTLENGASFALGEVGDAFSLNGSNQFVLIGQPVPANLQIQNELTLSAWIYVTAYPANNGSGAYAAIVGSQDGNTTSGAAIYLDGENGVMGVPPGAIQMDLGNGSQWSIGMTESQVPLNQWVLVSAVALANNPVQIYFNGVLQPVLQSNNANWGGTISYRGSWFAIGQDEVANDSFNGLIDEVQVYNVALTATQVQGIYSAGSAGLAPVTYSPINGVCGSASGQFLTAAPVANLCSAGTTSAVSSNADGTFTWSCNGQYGGAIAACTAWPPLPTTTQAEADSLIFSVLNGTNPIVSTTTQAEADSKTFSVLNAANPVTLGSIQNEADSATFSVLNGSNPVVSMTTPAEVDSLTFSLLNGETPAVGATVYEVDSPTFSVQNQAASNSAVARPAVRKTSNPGGIAASTLGADAPGAGFASGSRSGASAGVLPMAHKAGNLAGQNAPVAQGAAVSSQRGGRSLTPSTATNRPLHRRSSIKASSVSRTQAAFPQPKARAPSSNRSDSVSAAGQDAAPAPG